MVQSNVIVTYSPARLGAAPVAVRVSGGRGQRRLGLTLAGVLLAGGAAFTLGTFVRPDGTIRDAHMAMQPQTGPEEADERERAEPSVQPDATAASAAEARAAKDSRLPFLALVGNVAPSPSPSPSAAAARPLDAPAALAAAPGTGREAMRAERRPVPAPARDPVIAVPAPDDGPAVAARLTPPPAPAPRPAPTPGLRRDLDGFLSEQGLVLAAEPQPSGTIAPVSEWAADDFVAADASPSPLAAATPLADPGELAPERGDSSVSIAEPVTEPPVHGLAAEASDDLALAEAVSPVDAPIAAAESADKASTNSMVAGDADDGEHAREPGLRLAAASVAPIPASPAATVTPAPTQTQSFPLTVMNGELLGAVTLRDGGVQGPAIHLGALVGLLKLRMPQAEFERLSTAAAANRFVTLDQLRAAGIAVQWREREERLLIDTR